MPQYYVIHTLSLLLHNNEEDLSLKCKTVRGEGLRWETLECESNSLLQSRISQYQDVVQITSYTDLFLIPECGADIVLYGPIFLIHVRQLIMSV